MSGLYNYRKAMWIVLFSVLLLLKGMEYRNANAGIFVSKFF